VTTAPRSPVRSPGKADGSQKRSCQSNDLLYRLRQEAPAWLENQHLARDLVGKIIAKRRKLTADMRELADFVHLAR
jgi:hypothetical protein